jgi:CheY-like chemotaxis protein
MYLMGDSLHASALIADDSPVEHSALRDAVSGECQRVIEARDGAEAFELCRRYVPDLIVWDLRSGLDSLAKIQADSELAAVPLIRLAEPVEPAELRARVREALRAA